MFSRFERSHSGFSTKVAQGRWCGQKIPKRSDNAEHDVR